MYLKIKYCNTVTNIHLGKVNISVCGWDGSASPDYKEEEDMC